MRRKWSKATFYGRRPQLHLCTPIRVVLKVGSGVDWNGNGEGKEEKGVFGCCGPHHIQSPPFVCSLQREGDILPVWFAWKVHRSKSNASELAPHAVDNTKLKLSTGQMLEVIAGLRRTPENNWDSLKSNSVGREQKAPEGVLQEGHIPRKQFLFRWWQNHVAALQYASIF